MDKAKTTKELNDILMHAENRSDLEDALQHDEINPDCSFADYFRSLDKVKKMNRGQLIRAALIDRTYGYQILDGRKHPSRDKVIALALASNLDEKEMRRALLYSGYAPLYAKERRDAVLIYALHHHMSVRETNELLYDFDEAVLA